MVKKIKSPMQMMAEKLKIEGKKNTAIMAAQELFKLESENEQDETKWAACIKTINDNQHDPLWRDEFKKKYYGLRGLPVFERPPEGTLETTELGTVFQW